MATRGFKPGSKELRDLWEKLSKTNPPPRGLAVERTLDSITIFRDGTRPKMMAFRVDGAFFLMAVAGIAAASLTSTWLSPLGWVMPVGAFVLRNRWHKATPDTRIIIKVDGVTVEHQGQTDTLAFFEDGFDPTIRREIIKMYHLHRMNFERKEVDWIWEQVVKAQEAAERRFAASSLDTTARDAVQGLTAGSRGRQGQGKVVSSVPNFKDKIRRSRE